MMVVLLRALAITGALLLAIDARAGAPVFFQALDPVRPDETFLLFGADVTPGASAEGLRLEDTEVVGPPARVVDEPSGVPGPMTVLQATDLSAKILIPKSWAPGAYAVRVRTEAGVSAWRFANRPALWWQLSGVGGAGNPGGDLRIFGKNFGSRSRLWLVDGANKREIPLRVARDYDVDATLPSDLVPGKYQVWIHNGHGGNAGFGEPLNLEVAPADPWPTTVFNVRKLGAKGDNIADDTEAVRMALRQAAKNGGGIVQFPRGIYIIRGRLTVPRKTVLRGESTEAVWLKVPTDAASFDAVIAGEGQFTVENLSIIAKPVDRLIASPDVPDTFTKGWARWRAEDARLGQVTLRNLRLQHLMFTPRLTSDDPRRQVEEGPTAVALRGPDCRVESCDIVSAGYPLQISAATRATVSRNHFGTGRNGANGFWDLRESVFEENEVEGRDLEGTYGGVQNVAQNVMFRGNFWHDAYGGEREGLVFDSPYYPIWMGRVEVTDSKIAFKKRLSGHWPPTGEDGEDFLALVLGGKGLGQMLPVGRSSIDGAAVLEPPAVSLDDTSIVGVFPTKRRVLVVGNHFADAFVCPQLYAQCNEFLIAGNRAERTAGSHSLAGDFVDQFQLRRTTSAFFNQWIDNTFSEGLVPGPAIFPGAFVGYLSGRGPGISGTTVTLGPRFTGNRLNGQTFMGGKGEPIRMKKSERPDAPGARDAIFEHNRVEHSNRGIEIDAGHAFSLLRDNAFFDVSRIYADKGFQTKILPSSMPPSSDN